jgi:hypothetical protein
MRRKVVLALCASAIAAPIPVAALAQTGPDVGDITADAVMRKAELRKEARTAKRAAERRVAERKQARQARRQAAAAPAVSPALEAIAACESGGDPTAVSPDGLYHGKYQFSPATWAAVGGSGLPSQAPEAEQDMRAAMLYEQSGPGQWPVCGQ